MQVILHAGAHCTDDDRLLKCLLKNKDAFRKEGIGVPGPSRYRRLLRDTLNALNKAAPEPDAREVVLDAILEEDDIDRLILSNDNFFGVPKLAYAGGRLYPQAEQKLQALGKLFPDDDIELYFAIRDPATFLPALFAQTPFDDFTAFLGGADPRVTRWSELVARMRDALPGLTLTLWCNEDTPLIWAEIVREVAGLLPNAPIEGGFDLLSEIMSKEGMMRFRAYLKSHEGMTEIQTRRVIAAFLDKFGLEDALEEEIDLPGWTDDLVASLTEAYEEDVYTIQRMPGVQLITP